MTQSTTSTLLCNFLQDLARDSEPHIVYTIPSPSPAMPGTRGAVPVPLQNGGRDLTQQILDLLDTKEPLNTHDDFPSIPQNEIKAALDRLASRFMLTYDTQDSEQITLTSEGRQICDEGSHEYKVWDAVQKRGKVSIKELPVRTCH